MRTRRILAFVLLGVCLIEGLSSGVREFFVLFGLLCITLVFSLISALLRSRSMAWSQQLTDDCIMSGEKTELMVRFRRSLSPALVKLTVHTPQGAQYAVLPVIHRKEKKERYPMVCERRGEFEVGVERAEIFDLFGLFRFAVYPSAKEEQLLPLITTPRAFYIPCHMTVGASDNGTVAASGSISSENSGIYSESRQYQRGDSLKRIHWKLSVRTGELHTRLYEKSEASPALLLVDSSVPPDGKDNPDAVYDKICECAATVGWNLILQGHPFQLTDNEGELTRCDGESSFPSVLRRLASFSQSSKTPLPDILGALSGQLGKCQIYLFTNQLTSMLMDVILRVRENGNFVTVVMVGPLSDPLPGSGNGLQFLTVGVKDDTARALEAGL